MAKLQRIKRINGSLVFSVNIPLDIIEELKWEKSDKLNLEIIESDKGKIITIIRDKNG